MSYARYTPATNSGSAERESTMDSAAAELPLLSPGDRAAFEREMQGC
jgi:hypothetical protein